MSSPEEFFNNLPRVTRGWLVSALAATAMTSLQMISPYTLVFLPEAILYNFEIWRLISCFIFLGPLGFPFVMQLFFLVRYSAALEANPYPTTRGSFQGSTADYVFCVLFCGALMIVVGYFMKLMLLGPPLVFALLYLWSRRNPEAPISFWGFRFKGIHLPWVLMAFGILLGNSPVMDLLGIAVGHVFYFIVEVLPLKYGRDFINTPLWLIQAVDAVTGDFTAVPVQGGNVAGAYPGYRRPGGYQWGQGRTLDD